MAGLWVEWTDKRTGERIKSCTIVTCPANALVGALHDRMPVIVTEEDWAKWLGEVPATNDELKALLVPFGDDALTMWPVNRQKIGNVRNKDREVAEPSHSRHCLEVKCRWGPTDQERLRKWSLPPTPRRSRV